MDAGERDLFESRRCDALDVPQNRRDRHAARRAARRRDDAVGARLGAPRLHAERVRRPSGNARLDRGAARAVAIAEPLGRGQPLVDQRNQPRLVVVRHDLRDVRQRADFVGPPRRVATGDDNARRRIVARDPANRLARALIGGRRHRARVDDHQIGPLGRRRFRAGADQRFFKAERVGLVDAAAEGDDGIPESAIFAIGDRRFCL